MSAGHRVTYQLSESIATITLDDGKKNALSLETFAELGAAFDRAAADGAAVVLTGREGAFSAGFDLRELGGGGAQAARLVLAGFDLAARVFAFPAPVVVACTGHAIAMGLFLALTGDYRLGAAGPYKLGANETAIGLVLPAFAMELCRHRLAPTHFHRAVVLAEMFAPEGAVAAGILDRVVAPAELPGAARALAAQATALPRAVFAATKLRARAPAIEALRVAREADAARAS
ncbi:MAG TPA: crotonase/enoyl-CoA hydratase family protein [Haliangiales bacterium]|nr:crotonase/enoyl-CoA hydratase family protein [Haliangiales bacterium]